MKNSRISRIIQILTTMQAGKSYAVEDLSKMFGTSRRTIFRDLKELQSIGVPYHFDSETGGYVIDPEFFLPPVDLDLKEALSLLLLVHKVGDEIQLPFKKSALLAALKIANNLPPNIRRYCNTALKTISAKTGAQAPVERPGGLDAVFTKLQNALTRRRKVGIRYNSLAERKIIDLELSPYHLFYNQRAWYVLGRSSMHKSIRTFKLNRIRALQITDKRFIDGDSFDPHEYFGRAWSMIPEGRIYNIKLKFLTKVAHNVAEVRWHSTQAVTRNNDGSATIEFRVDGLGEITWWILGYGDQVRVLAPRALRKRVLEIARNMIKINEKV
ncbi:MAG: WYL domain-containing protein [Phycisphaerae bacterium]|nr:WYL domain-containing protein [Phycisphaerae bacterium]